jgi:5-methylcytosine-specific restriction endonuclease McrA
MTRAKKVCGHAQCPNLMPCPEHRKVPWAGSTRRSELPPDWERRRRAVLRRDVTCQDGRVCGGLALAREVHHTGQPDDHNLMALQGICADCHKAATSAQATAARIGA